MHPYINNMAKPKYDIIEVGETFVYGRLHLDTAFDIYNSITEEVDEAELEQGEIGGDENNEPINANINLMASIGSVKARKLVSSHKLSIKSTKTTSTLSFLNLLTGSGPSTKM